MDGWDIETKPPDTDATELVLPPPSGDPDHPRRQIIGSGDQETE